MCHIKLGVKSIQCILRCNYLFIVNSMIYEEYYMCVAQWKYIIIFSYIWKMAKMGKIWLFNFFQKGGGFFEQKLILIASSDSPMVWEDV